MQQRPGKVTVPVLWDKEQECIVSNESSEIIRMFNSSFNHITKDDTDYYPKNLKKEIDKVNKFVYENINNGVYRCGFAKTQEAYEQAFKKLFKALDKVEDMLWKQKYLAGDVITEADWRLFTTLIRFDAVYHRHFKCNKMQLKEYEHIHKYLKHLYNLPGIKSTVDFKHIKRHYYYSHITINRS